MFCVLALAHTDHTHVLLREFQPITSHAKQQVDRAVNLRQLPDQRVSAVVDFYDDGDFCKDIQHKVNRSTTRTTTSTTT